MGVGVETHEVEEWFSPYAVKRRSPPWSRSRSSTEQGLSAAGPGPWGQCWRGQGVQERLGQMLSAGVRVSVHAFTASFPSHVHCLTSLSAALQFLPFHPWAAVRAVFKCRLPGTKPLHLVLTGA